MSTDMFVKKAQSPQAAQREFDRTVHVHETVAEHQTSVLRIARPIKLDGRRIYLERLHGWARVRQLICRHNPDTDMLFKVGQALAELHLALNGPVTDPAATVEVHGDFWAANAMYSPCEQRVCICDFGTPQFNSSPSYCHRTVYDDMAPFIINLEIKYPLQRIYLLARIRTNRQMTDAFLAGYEHVMDKPVDRRQLAMHIVDWCQTYAEVFRHKNPLSRTIWMYRFQTAAQRYRQEHAQA